MTDATPTIDEKDIKPTAEKEASVISAYAKKKGRAAQGKAKTVAIIPKGQMHVQSTYNNTIVTMTDLNGNVLGWASAGGLGFKGAKKATPFAATQIVASLIEKVKDHHLIEVDVYVKGIGAGREAAVRALHTHGIEVNNIKDITPLPHNGVRSKKPRRV